MKLIRYLVLVGVLLGIIVVATWVWQKVAIDRCLDAGSRWSYQESKCERLQQKSAPGHLQTFNKLKT